MPRVEGSSTIAAIATAPGKGAVGMVRISGPRAFAVAKALCGGRELPVPRIAGLRQWIDARGQAIDSGLVLCFEAPNSFTGEDVVELQGHGGPVVLAEVLAACLAAGAEPAQPGEFSERAFLNDKLDLAQAEAIADLIDASSAQAVRAAQATLQGSFSQRIQSLVQQLIDARVWIEGALDFSDEDVDWLGDNRLHSRLRELQQDLSATIAGAQQGVRLRDGVQLALIGAPNSGKSTLLNALAGYEAAIVSATPGTTRDVVKEHLVLGGLPITVIDTAGLRLTDDQIEAEGIRRARETAHRADVVLVLVDATQDLSTRDVQQLLPDAPAQKLIPVLTKTALSDHATPTGWVGISAREGLGLSDLVAAIHAKVFHVEQGEGQFMARARHMDALHTAAAHLTAAQSLLPAHSPELAAEELRLAQAALGRITGQFDADALLGEIFRRFCIGK